MASHCQEGRPLNRIGVFSDTRQTDTTLAFQLMLEHVGDRKISDCFFDSGAPPFDAIARATWLRLEENKCVKAFLDSQRYVLTGTGWLRALEETGGLQDRAFQREAKKLLAGIKKSAKGKQGGARMMTVHALARHCGVSEPWVYNAIEGRLIEAQFDLQGPAWVHGFEGTAVYVPIGFGAEL